MEFLAPLMLVGALGAAIPIAIHLIGRRRARVVHFAAVDFLLGSDRKVARRLELRQLLLLLLRAIICVALALILAKPFATCAADGPVVERGPQAAVIVVDDALGMRFAAAGEPLAERARARARSILEGLGPEADVAVLRTSEGDVAAAAELSRDHLALRDRLERLATPSHRPADVTAALRRAGQLLAASPHEARTIYLVSALPAAGFADPPVPWARGGEAPELRVVDVAGDVELDNAAVTAVAVEPDPASGPRGMRVIAEVANFGAAPLRGREIALRIGGDVVARGRIDVGPGERARKRFSTALPPDRRTAEVAVELAPDALPVDDRRHAIAELREQIPVLLVDGDPRGVRHEDELFYLEAALRPGDRADSGVVLTTTTADRLGELDLASFDVVVLANVAALEPDRVAALARWVESGGGLLVSVGDQVDPAEYDRRMTPLLAQRLQSVLDTGHGRGAADPALRTSKLERDHPIFSVFSADAGGMRQARYRRVMLLGPTTDVDDRRVLVRYDNGGAALVEARRGEGRLLLYTSTIDRDWNDLPIHPGYLPFVQQTVRYLARKPFQRRDAQLLVGQPAALRVGAEDVRLEVDGPGERRTVLEGDELEGRELVRFAGTDAPGFYRVRATSTSGDRRARPESAFAVNVAPRASDLRRLDPSVLVGAERGEAGAVGPALRERRVELWHALALALLALLVVESLVGLGSRR